DRAVAEPARSDGDGTARGAGAGAHRCDPRLAHGGIDRWRLGRVPCGSGRTGGRAVDDEAARCGHPDADLDVLRRVLRPRLRRGRLMSALKPVMRELKQAVLNGLAHAKDKLHRLAEKLDEHFATIIRE